MPILSAMEQPNIPQDSTNPQPLVEPQEESIFQESDYSMEGYDKHIRQARNALFVVAAIQFIGVFFVKSENELARNISMGILGFIALIFVGLAFWTKKRPYTALMTALIIYGALVLLDAIVDPSTIIKGIVLKIGIIIALISGLRNAREAVELRKAFGKA